MKTTLVTAGIIASLVLGVVNFGKPLTVSVSPTPVEVNVPKQNTPVVNVAAPDVKVTAPSQTLGAVTGPDFYFDYLNVNGVKTYNFTKEFTTSTTTVCAIQSPRNSTSTLMTGGALFTTSSTTAATVTISKSATAFATTTKLGEGALSANGQGFLLASTTATTAGGTGSNLNPAYVFGPGQWFVVGMQGGVGTFSPVGQCQAQFQAFQ